MRCRREKNPERALAEASTLSGLSFPFFVGPGTQLRSGRLWPKPPAVRSEDRGLPVSGEELQTFRSAGLWAARRSRGIPVRLLAGPGRLRFPFDIRADFRPGFPVFRSEPFPAVSHHSGSVVEFPRRRGGKSRPSPRSAQAENLIVFRELRSVFANHLERVFGKNVRDPE